MVVWKPPISVHIWHTNTRVYMSKYLLWFRPWNDVLFFCSTRTSVDYENTENCCVLVSGVHGCRHSFLHLLWELTPEISSIMFCIICTSKQMVSNQMFVYDKHWSYLSAILWYLNSHVLQNWCFHMNIGLRDCHHGVSHHSLLQNYAFNQNVVCDEHWS